MAFATLKILDYAVYYPGILVLIHHKGSGRTKDWSINPSFGLAM